jgi:hypothetical protein
MTCARRVALSVLNSHKSRKELGEVDQNLADRPSVGDLLQRLYGLGERIDGADVGAGAAPAQIVA